MEGATDVVNCNPLPQRNANGITQNQQSNQQNNAQGNTGGANVEKKPRMDGGNLGGGGGGGGGGMQGNRDNRNNSGRGGRGGNRNFGNRNNAGGGGGPNNNMGGGGGGGNRGNHRQSLNKSGDGHSQDFSINQKIKQLSGSTHEIPSIELEEIKFSGRNRLYVGNLTNDITDEELTELFKPYGEISEGFINKDKNFAFLKVDYHANAERAKRELDGKMRKNRALRIRFAPNATTIRVKNLTQFVTNELLYKAFEVFGPVERAVIIMDDRGKSTGEGIVEYARKAGALTAIRYCTEKCFFLTASLRPCVVEPFEHSDDTDGYSEKSLNKKTNEFYKARQVGPRFAEIGSFEHEYGTRWKQLHELYKQKHEALKREMQMEEEKLEVQMEYARYEHETELLREQLRQREQEREHKKHEWDLKERQAEENRSREEEQMRRQQDEMQLRMHRQEEELRRRQQENNLFMQAQQLNSMLDQSEMNQNNRNKNFDGNDNRGVGGNQGRNFGDMSLMNQGVGGMGNQQNNRQSRFDDQGQGGAGGNNNGPRGNRQWNDRRDDFQNKRRRF